MLSSSRDLPSSSRTICNSEVTAIFDDGNGGELSKSIAGSYVEFAERREGRDGFDSQNADKIFESTYRSQTDH